MNNLQTILVAVFLAFFVFAVLIFSGLIKLGGSSNTSSLPVGKVVVWGTFSSADLSHAFDGITEANRDLNISYIQKDPATYQQSLIEAFASGSGPDVFFITPDMVIKDKQFIYTIPYSSYPQKTFSDSFIDGASVYASSNGILGFPIVADPMVLYYNKDLLTNEGIAQPPTYWDELFDLNPRLTKSKDDGTILQSMIGLGRFDNVNHAKDILATLLLQSNNSIIAQTDSGYTPTLSGSSTITPLQSDNVFSFFAEFSNPSDGGYSYNSALPNSLDMFTGGKLVMYLGRASELFKIQSTNPNLSFDVAEIMQTRNTNIKRTDGPIYAIAINKSSKNLTSAFGFAGLLATGDNAKNFAAAVSLPPVLKSLLAVKPDSPYMFTFFDSALFTHTWLDPDTVATDGIFGELIQNIISNKLSVSDAVSKAQSQLQLLLSGR